MQFAQLKSLPLAQARQPLRLNTDPRRVQTAVAAPSTGVRGASGQAPARDSVRRRARWLVEVVGSCLLMGLFLVVALFS